MTLTKVGRSKAAKARKANSTTTYAVQIVGHAWGGFRSTYRYQFDHLPTKQEITSKAGDFESVDDYEVMAVTHYGDWQSETTKRKIVKEWDNDESGLFASCCE